MKNNRIRIPTALAIVAGFAGLVVLFTTFFLIYKNIFPMTSFSDRILSAASVKGVDVSHQILVYMTGLTTAGALLFLFCKRFCVICFSRTNQLRRSISTKSTFKKVIIVGFVALVLFKLILSWKQNHSILQILLYLLLFIYIAALLLMSKTAYIKWIPRVIDIGFYFSLLYSVLSLISALIEKGVWLTIATAVMLLLAMILPLCLRPKCRVILYALPIAYLLTDLFFFRFGLSTILLFGVKAVLFVSATVFSFLPTKNKWLIKEHKTLCYCLLIIGLAFVGTGGYSIAYTPDYFEYANHAVSIDGLLNFGKFPILESFDAHMLYDQLPGYLYYLFVGNASDAALLGRAWEGVNLSLYYVFVFILLSRLIHKDQVLLIVLFLPQNCFGMYYLPFALWVTLLLMKNDHRGLYVVYWAVMIFSVIYRLDTGLCCVFACVPIILLYFIRRKNYIGLRRLLISFALVAVPVTAIGFGICIIKGIDIFTIAQRFLLLSSKSNQNWAYGILGFDRIRVLLVYYIANALCAVLLVSVLLKCLLAKKQTLFPRHYIVAAAGIAWFVNLPRTIVRHSAVELEPVALLSCALFFVFLYIVVSVKTFRNWKTILCLIACAAILIPGNTLSGRLDMIQSSQSVYEDFPAASTVSRLSFDRTKGNSFSDILNTLLEENETFYDFSNNGLLFPLTGRENPVYENQSPGLLSGERAQQITIAELESKKAKVACALFPAGKLLKNQTGLSVSIDGVFNEDRYYLLAEYLYRNYIPVLRWGEYDIWLNSQLVKQRADRVASLGKLPDIELLSGVSANDYVGKKHSLGAIPYLWANADEKKLSEKKLLCNLDNQNGRYYIPPEIIDAKNGNYLCVTINSPNNSNGILSLNYDGTKEQYEFNIKKGTTNYLFRVSSNYKWYCSQNKVLSIDNLNNSQTTESVCVLMGDSLN